jgi:hypothetical protein
VGALLRAVSSPLEGAPQRSLRRLMTREKKAHCKTNPLQKQEIKYLFLQRMS